MDTIRLAVITVLVTLGLVAATSAATARDDPGTSVPPTTTRSTPRDPGSSTPQPAPGQPANPGAPAPAGGVGFDEATRIALEQAGGGRVTDAEWDTEYGRAVWEIEIVNAGAEHDLRVDADSGAVLRHEREGRDDDCG